MEDDATIRMVFAKRQPLKGVKNYFTYALLYQEISKAPKEPLPDNEDSGNEQIQSLKETHKLLWPVNQL